MALNARTRPSAATLKGVVGLWAVLAASACWWAATLSEVWRDWSLAFAAVAIWGLNILLFVYGLGGRRSISSVPFLGVVMALAMTIIGSANYWAATQLYPSYQVEVERAALFIAVCTCVSLIAMVVVSRALPQGGGKAGPSLKWQWPRVRFLTYVLFLVSFIGTVVSVRRIGYIPILVGDPTSARVEFPAIGGVWYRLSMLGGAVAMLVGTLAAARQATPAIYAVGIASLVSVGLYGPRFFVALPLGVGILMWDRMRNSLRIRRIAGAVVFAVPLLALGGYLRQRDPSASVLGPIGLVAYFAFVEFRELAWALEHYGGTGRFLLGGTLGSAIVPLLPSPIWAVLGIDKPTIYAHGSAAVLADAMGADSGQRIGAYGEFFINFGWTGAIVGAALYGVLIAYLDRWFHSTGSQHVRGVFLALTIASAVFAQIGQLDLFTSTLTGFGYPLALIALLASRRLA
jgi:hypothetical protein